MKESRQTIRRTMSASVFVAAGLAWLAVVLYMIIGKVIARETNAGGLLAHQIDKLPLFLAKPAYIVLWSLFFLGWIVPLVMGIKRIFRRTGDDFPIDRNGATLGAARR
jgi:hypothetical protein